MTDKENKWIKFYPSLKLPKERVSIAYATHDERGYRFAYGYFQFYNGTCGCFWKDGNEQPKVVKAEDIKYWMPVPSLDVKEEPVSEDLEKAAEEWDESLYRSDAFKAGAQWQKNHFWKSADGNDLPEYDREVIAILDYDFGHYKVVYAHRPNPNGWNGTNIDTEEKEHFEPEIYDKGGWNQPHVLYWLDAKLPYEENKIIE